MKTITAGGEMRRYNIHGGYVEPWPSGDWVFNRDAQAEMDHLYEALERAALEIVRLEDKVKQARAETLREAADMLSNSTASVYPPGSAFEAKLRSLADKTEGGDA